MASRKVKGLCCVGGRYRRTIGRFLNSSGKIAPRKFLLGTDRDQAERANLRLEQLWRDIDIHWHKDALGRPCASEPIWDPLTLSFADAIRTGQRIALPTKEIEARDALAKNGSAVANWYWWVRATYPSVADLVDEPTHPAFKRSKQSSADQAKVLAGLSRRFAELACEPAAAAPPGHTLYAALDAWAEDIRKARTLHDGELPESGRKIIEAAARLKDAHDDLPLDRLDFNSVNAIANHWYSRPPSKASGKNHGKPISVVTVQNMLGYLKQFLTWLHRNREYQWRDTDRIIEDATGNRRTASIRTPEEIKKEAQGPDGWTVNELVQLYRHATEIERLYLLLGLNGGFAQSEIVHLMTDEIHLNVEFPMVAFIRHKTGKRGVFSLWPETAKGLAWALERQERFHRNGAKWALLTKDGEILQRQRISNAWRRLILRVQNQVPGFRSLPFKMLRKTNAQLIASLPGRNSEVVALIHARAKRTEHDDQADAYYGRYEQEVRGPLMALRDRLKPMFESVDEIFAERRTCPRPTRHMPAEKVKLLLELRSQGMGVIEVAKRVQCSPSSVSRYAKMSARMQTKRS